jgi:DNA-binding MarR family transcriptional regulator
MTEKRGAPFAFDGLDRIFHEKARLGILTSLAGHPKGLGFTELKELCGLTDGNLSRHIQVLEEAGLIALTKGYEGKRPHTRCRMTETGRARFATYLAALEKVLKDAARANAKVQAGKKGHLREQPA